MNWYPVNYYKLVNIEFYDEFNQKTYYFSEYKNCKEIGMY